MNAALAAVRQWGQSVASAWDRFWFTPDQPYTLALIRILGGAMLFYTHLVWTLRLTDFLGPTGFLPPETVALLNQPQAAAPIFAWSYLAAVQSPALIWTLHIVALVVLAMLTVGLWSRVTSVLAFIIAVSYCHRLTGSLFGLDQINVFIAMYLMLGSSGEVWSVDRWLALRRHGSELLPIRPAIGTNIGIRLLQLHMCVIYLFGGIGKMRGEWWWDGSAVWLAVGNYEYQSLDMTWLGHSPWLIALLAHVTVFWETFYCFFVWPKLTRPICLALAVAVHGGIALFLGMPTFGIAMIIGNLAFVPPQIVRGVVTWLARPFTRAASSGQLPSEMVAAAAR